jgi:hypothetical protein
MSETTPNRPRQQLPTARIAFPQQLNILRAYAAASGPDRRAVSNDEVAEIVKLSKTTVPLANPFFSATELIEKADGKYIPAKEVFDFAETFGWGGSHEETAASELAPLIERTWFARALLPKLSFGSISKSEALTTLAKAAGVPPDNRQLALLLEYLEAARLVSIDGDQIRGSNAQVKTEKAEPEPVSVPAASATAPVAQAPIEDTQLPMLVRGLIDKLPDEASGWDAKAAERWLALAKATFPMAYDYDAEDEPPRPRPALAGDDGEGGERL